MSQEFEEVENASEENEENSDEVVEFRISNDILDLGHLIETIVDYYEAKVSLQDEVIGEGEEWKAGTKFDKGTGISEKVDATIEKVFISQLKKFINEDRPKYVPRT